MIFGVGIDIIDVKRIKKEISTSGHDFKFNLFTENEIKYCDGKRNSAENYAARFAAKEAFFKAIGTGWRNGLGWKEAGVQNDELGKPGIVLYGKAKTFVEENNISKLQVSLSHIKDAAVAIVILESF